MFDYVKHYAKEGKRQKLKVLYNFILFYFIFMEEIKYPTNVCSVSMHYYLDSWSYLAGGKKGRVYEFWHHVMWPDTLVLRVKTLNVCSSLAQRLLENTKWRDRQLKWKQRLTRPPNLPKEDRYLASFCLSFILLIWMVVCMCDCIKCFRDAACMDNCC